jgi:hypothetical protein
LKDGYIEKGYTPLQDDFDKIRQFTRKEFTADELYIFSLILCNNDIDRDYEKFSVSALYELAKLFVGKTGIRDHSMKAADQTARIFDTWVEKLPNRKTADGEDFYVLRAKAYMVRSEENKSLITEIEAGIKKEVSVSCSMALSTCSVCGKSRKNSGCSHINGRKYGGKTCFSILSNAADAYEWSFVAVPAQREAGVTKSFNIEKGDSDMTDIKKCLSTEDEQIVLSNKQAKEICSYIEEREELAALGEEYKKSLIKELVSLCAKTVPQMDLKVFGGVAAVMTTKELLSFKNAFEKQQAVKNMPAPQLSVAQNKPKDNFNEFRI